jgi:hypothetical protein
LPDAISNTGTTIPQSKITRHLQLDALERSYDPSKSLVNRWSVPDRPVESLQDVAEQLTGRAGAVVSLMFPAAFFTTIPSWDNNLPQEPGGYCGPFTDDHREWISRFFTVYHIHHDLGKSMRKGVSMRRGDSLWSSWFIFVTWNWVCSGNHLIAVFTIRRIVSHESEVVSYSYLVTP